MSNSQLSSAEPNLSNALSPQPVGEAIGGGNYNGGSYSGKLSYLRYEVQPSCLQNPFQADSKILSQNGIFQLYLHDCKAPASAPAILIAAPKQNSYNPYYVLHNQFPYFLEGLLSDPLGAGERLVVTSFCTNPDFENPTLGQRGLDVAVRMRQTFSSPEGWLTKHVVHFVFGQVYSPTSHQQQEDPASRIDSDGKAVRIYQSDTMNSPYFSELKVELSHDGGVSRGFLTLNDHLAAIPLTCYGAAAAPGQDVR